jgi:alkylation response protein AidB-like acyl-CoA dehydrogenase
MGIGMCGPTIVAWGSEDQKKRFLRPIYTAEEIWCQLFSEPGAGSDVASLSTRAVRDGQEWIVNGQKVWTSSAHLSKWGLLLARTDPDAPKHRGITAFIVDMEGPGVEIRPLRQISGGSGFNEVFFTDTIIPDHLRVGEPGEGWRVGTATLMNERVSIGGVTAPRGSGAIGEAVAVWKRRADQDPVRRDALLQLWVAAEVLRLGNLRAQAMREKGIPGPEGSALKLGGALLTQRITSFTVDLLGPAGMLSPGYDHADETSTDPVLAFLGSQCTTIAGGTSEIMRNILGERVLGLPREPGIDPKTPWSQIPHS